MKSVIPNQTDIINVNKALAIFNHPQNLLNQVSIYNQGKAVINLASLRISQEKSYGQNYEGATLMSNKVTFIPNLLLEALAMAKISGTEQGIILLIILKSNFKKAVVMPLSELANKLDTTPSLLFHSLKKLVNYKIITRYQPIKWREYYYSINLNINEWDNSCINHDLLLGKGKICIRCGREDHLNQHHKIFKSRGGSDEPHNKEPRCSACHTYLHSRQVILDSIEVETQPNRLAIYYERLRVIDELNTPEFIKERGTYQTWGIRKDILTIPPRVKSLIGASHAENT